jgi:hypothetical protein
MNIELTESNIMQLLELAQQPENRDLFVNPLSMMVKVGDTEMENN